MKARLLSLFALLLTLCFVSPAMADEAAKVERRTPVVVEFEGSDVLGATLFNRLQDTLNSTRPTASSMATTSISRRVSGPFALY